MGNRNGVRAGKRVSGVSGGLLLENSQDFFGTSKSTPLVLQLRKLGPGTKVAESRSHCLGSSLQWMRLWLKKHTPVLHVLMGLLQAQAVVGKVGMDLCPRVDSCWQLREGPG